MKWQSHLRIAEWVGSELIFSKQNLLQLAEGSIAPDKWRDHSYHHNYLDSKISERIVRARRLFLKNNSLRSKVGNKYTSRGSGVFNPDTIGRCLSGLPLTKYFFETGVALHYIADRLVPKTSYLEHLNIEEEIAEISKSRKEDKSRWHSKDYKKYIEKIRMRIEELEIGEEEKTLLLDPTWTKGKRNTLTLALTNLPLRTDSELLLHIASRISIGVTASIISRDPPPQLLWEKFKFAEESISKAIPKIKSCSIFVITLPLLFLVYGKIGVVAYFSTLLLNLWALIPIIFKKTNTPKNYLIFRDRSKTLFIFWLSCSLVSLITVVHYNSKFLLPAVVLFLIALLHLFPPKIMIDTEIENEIDWYGWD